jgi:hypothetical protein
MHRPDVHPKEKKRDTDNENRAGRIAGNEEDENDMSNEPAKPDAGTDVETMSLEAIQRELREPSSASVESAEHRERRQVLWRRLDQLTRPGAVITAERA